MRLRKEHKDVFVYGEFELLDVENPNTFIFRKQHRGKAALIALNFTSREQGAPQSEDMRLLESSYAKARPEVLQPFEGRVYINY